MQEFDVAIIGAGPSGTITAKRLQKMGWRVVVIERGSFPRFTIGESMLPHMMDFLAEADMLEAIKSEGFQRKFGATFWRDGQEQLIDFSDRLNPESYSETWEVPRERFDSVLAENAQAAGVPIWFNTDVKHVTHHVDHITLDIEKANILQTISCKYVCDASGAGRVMSKLMNMEKPDVLAERKACFTHVKDLDNNAYQRETIHIIIHPDNVGIWFWLIPFSTGIASLGVVGEPHLLAEFGSTPEEILWNAVARCPRLSPFYKADQIVRPVRELQGYSHHVSKLYGDRFALLGNAGEFLDPVFSSGLTVALKSSSLAVPLVDQHLKGETVDWEGKFEIPMRAGIEVFRTFVTRWYTGDFQDIIFYPQKNAHVLKCITSILAGYVWDTDNRYNMDSEQHFEKLLEICGLKK